MLNRKGADYSKVKRILADQGRTGAWLARQLGMHRITFEHIERGHYPAPDLYYERIAGILNVSVGAVKPEPEAAAVV
jgi:DNA-binding XRE family transcriptional regulator